MNLTALLLECYRRLNFTSTPMVSVTVRLTTALSEAQRRLLSSPGMEQLRDETTTAASVVGQTRLTLPGTVARVRSIVDGTNQVRLRAMRRSDERRLNPGLTGISGIPDFYVPIGQEQVFAQPAAATGLWVVSTSVTDVGNLLMTGLTTGGYQFAPTFTALTGTTRRQVGTRTDITQVATFSLQQPATGFVSLYTAVSGGTELVRIEPGRLVTRFFVVDLLPTPSTAVTYTIDYTRVIPDFAAAFVEEPFIPEDFHHLLITMALRREYLYQDDKTRYMQLAMEEQEGMRAFRAFVLFPPDYRVRNTDPEEDGDGASNLGSYYPSGRW